MTIKRLIRCARCGGDHENIHFTTLTHGTNLFDKEGDGPYDYWAPCPTNGEPILLVKTIDRIESSRIEI